MRARLILIATLLVDATAVFAAEFVKQATAGVKIRQIDRPNLKPLYCFLVKRLAIFSSSQLGWVLI